MMGKASAKLAPGGPPTGPGVVSRRMLVQGLAGLAGLACGTVRAGPVDPNAPPPGLAADFDPVRAVWISAGGGHDVLTAGLVRALKGHVKIVVMVPEATVADPVRSLEPAASVVVEPGATFFLRDVAVFTREADGGPGIVDFGASQYGAAAWCLKRFAAGAERDHCVAHAARASAERDGLDRAIARHLGAPVHRTPLAMEGGGVEANGRGLLLANAALWRSRHPGWSIDRIGQALRQLPGISRVVWLPSGLAEDVLLRGTITGSHVAWGSGGHTDQFVRFADERTVLLAWPDDADVAAHPVARLTRQAMQRNFAVLAAATDARGRRLRIVKVPTPRIVQRRVVMDDEADRERSEAWRTDYFAPGEGRRQGQTLWQVATASYLNFVVANGVVVLPDYRAHGTPPQHQDRVRRIVAGAFPGRRVEFVDAISANWVGGGLHCATLSQP